MDCISTSLGKRAEAGPITSGPAICESFVSKTQMASMSPLASSACTARPSPTRAFKSVKILRVVSNLDDARLVHPGNASIFEMLIVDLSLLSLLNNLIVLPESSGQKTCA